MRTFVISAVLLLLNPALALAQDGGTPNLLSPNGGVMFWTLIIFALLLAVLSRFAFRPMLAAVEAREQALQAALDKAARDRAEAAKLLEEHRAQLDAARGEAQRLIS